MSSQGLAVLAGFGWVRRVMEWPGGLDWLWSGEPGIGLVSHGAAWRSGFGESRSAPSRTGQPRYGGHGWLTSGLAGYVSVGRSSYGVAC